MNIYLMYKQQYFLRYYLKDDISKIKMKEGKKERNVSCKQVDSIHFGPCKAFSGQLFTQAA